MNITGYKLYLTNTMTSLGHARLILLAKSDLEIQLIPETNDTVAAMLWVKVGKGKKNAMLVGGIYRQHQLLGRSQKNLTKAQLQLEQEARWIRIVRRWRYLSTNTKCIVVGDLNMYQLKWSSPESQHEKIIENVEDLIETCGFVQLVVKITRHGGQQADSLLDHVCSNCSDRVVRVYNDSRGASDHNVVGAIVTMKDIKTGGQNVVRQVWKNFKEKECLKMFK